MRRRTALGAALLFLAAGACSDRQGPATTSLPGDGEMAAEADCLSGTLCIWDHPSYTGKMTILQPDECTEGPIGSAANKGIKQGDGLWLYEQPGCSGEYQIMRRNEARPELNSASARSKKIEY
jgi:hypothetical protein